MITKEQVFRAALEKIAAHVLEPAGLARLALDEADSLAHEPSARPGDDILDELEARGDALSKRAARYIRCKLAMLGEHPNRGGES